MRFPDVNAARGNSVLSLRSGSTQLTLKREKMINSSQKNNDHSFSDLRALKEFRVFSLSPGQVFLIGIINISMSFCLGLTFMSFV